MQITKNELEYKVGDYTIQVSKDFAKNKSEIFVFDKNNNILNSYASLEEAQNTAEAILKVVASVTNIS
jgi:hypothetical protein